METIFSHDRAYRYTLWRNWGDYEDDPFPVMFIGLNPSTADEKQDDPTVRRCIGFAKEWGFKSMVMTNIFAYRSTDPKALARVDDPVGPENDSYIAITAKSASIIVCCWGSQGSYRNRGGRIFDLLSSMHVLNTLGFTKNGCPRHPLYLRKGTQLQFWGKGIQINVVTPTSAVVYAPDFFGEGEGKK